MTSAMLNMMMAVVREEQLADPSWILDLDDIDEPPLFTRDEQVEFLYRIPRSERCVTALQVALMLLENVASAPCLRVVFRLDEFCWRAHPARDLDG